MKYALRALLTQLYTWQRALIALVFLLLMAVLWTQSAVYAWTFAAAAGVVLSLTLVKESSQDIQALYRDGSRNGRLLQASSRALREAIRFTVHALGIVAGLTALEILPFPREIIVPILIYGWTAFIANSAIDLVTRPYLYLTRKGEPDLEHDGKV